MMDKIDIQYVSNENGEKVAVIIPIDLWNDIESEIETQYLLKSPAMKKRLLEAKNCQNDLGRSLEEVRAELAI